LFAAIEEKAHTFDFGPGDDAYKFRFATGFNRVFGLGLYPAAGHSA
jgi:CelD/BcsL family acetyltransferase involved in cellulose biosynthesis